MGKPQEWKEYPAVMEMYDAMRDGIMAEAGKAGMSSKQEYKLKLGIEEIAVNIIKYAYDAPGFVWIRTETEGDFFRIDFADTGRRFNPLAEQTRGAYNDDEEDLEEGGLGIFLARRYFDKLAYTYENFRGKEANILSLWLKMA